MKTIIKNRQTQEFTNLEELSYHLGERAAIHGSIYKIRKMSGFAFVLLRTPRQVIQCIYSPEQARFPLESLREECCVSLSAIVKPEKRSRLGYELVLLEAEILSSPEEECPVVINHPSINASLETLLDYRPVTLRNEGQRAVFKIQEALVIGMRNFLKFNGFTEIHTPKIVSEGAEGGANIFQLDYFGKRAYLAQSPQFYKQMMVNVFERVFEIGPVFRAEKHDTSRHLNEYTGIDFEMGYIHSFEDIMEMEIGMLEEAFHTAEKLCPKEINLLNVQLPKLQGIPSIKFTEAKALLARSCFENTSASMDFSPEEEKQLCRYIQETTGSEFVFITHYPAAKRPFYAMENPENPWETLSFDLLFRGMEITTGGQRIHSYKTQVEKMKRLGLKPENFESYLLLHRYGTPPHGGLGLGLERLTSRLLGQDNVRLASLFPRDTHRLTP